VSSSPTARRFALTSTLAAVACLGPVSPVTHPMVTFVIDDGSWTDYTVKKPIFDAHGAVAVSAVISSRRFLTDSQLLAMQAAGWEIASHSRAHLDETRLTGAQLEEEIGGAKRDLEQVGLTVTTHVYPYGLFNAEVERVTRKCYEGGVAASGGPNPLPLADRYAIRRFVFGRQYARAGTDTLPTYERVVDEAKRTGQWLVFMLHEVDRGDAATLHQLLDYVRRQSIPIVTMREGLRSSR